MIATAFMAQSSIGVYETSVSCKFAPVQIVSGQRNRGALGEIGQDRVSGPPAHFQ